MVGTLGFNGISSRPAGALCALAFIAGMKMTLLVEGCMSNFMAPQQPRQHGQKLGGGKLHRNEAFCQRPGIGGGVEGWWRQTHHGVARKEERGQKVSSQAVAVAGLSA